MWLLGYGYMYFSYFRFFLPPSLLLYQTILTLTLLSSQASSTSRALADGHTGLSQQTQNLLEKLVRERLKDMALLDQDLRKTHAERNATNQATLATRREREGLRRVYFQHNPWRCSRIGGTVLSDFVLNFQDQDLTLPTLVKEYRQRFPKGWLCNPAPLPPLDQILPVP
ncbi:hypothetical protein LIER_39159 [Lithospermum erythrorhizon]|uniref:Uncharacterized protein n=1 Tax=Lithospermum erythrorhizon TaxID=34254 RepID=A0AAV3QCZ7_LITER